LLNDVGEDLKANPDSADGAALVTWSSLAALRRSSVLGS
jgi:hypothetical protein